MGVHNALDVGYKRTCLVAAGSANEKKQLEREQIVIVSIAEESTNYQTFMTENTFPEVVYLVFNLKISNGVIRRQSEILLGIRRVLDINNSARKMHYVKGK